MSENTIIINTNSENTIIIGNLQNEFIKSKFNNFIRMIDIKNDLVLIEVKKGLLPSNDPYFFSKCTKDTKLVMINHIHTREELADLINTVLKPILVNIKHQTPFELETVIFLNTQHLGQ